MILGVGGSGKSSLAVELGERLRVPVVHLDELYWSPGWVSAAPTEFVAAHAAAIAAEEWVIEGNYEELLSKRAARADAIVVLDLPRAVAAWDAFTRWVRWRGRARPGMTPGCPERMARGFPTTIWR